MKKNTIFLVITLLFTACSTDKHKADDRTIFVTISPLKEIVEQISCDDFEVRVLVPDGASPESYEPSAKQLTSLNDARLIFKIGLINFESSLTHNISDKSKVCNLCDGITTLAGSCSHHAHHHTGVDPHIWTSPKALRKMTINVRDALLREFPDSAKYSIAAEQLLNEIDSLDSYCQQNITDSGVKAMMIYHPAFTYYANDYGIEQIAIEHDGKEPTPKQLTAMVEKAKSENITAIFHQPQYSADKVRSIANETEAAIIQCDPLAKDILAEIRRITDIICGKNE
jgi:zinc transport system substrate-binding protein